MRLSCSKSIKKRVEFYQPDSNDVVKRIEDAELRRKLSDAINELPDKCRMVFKLSYLHDMKNKEIADTMGVSFAYGGGPHVQSFEVAA